VSKVHYIGIDLGGTNIKGLALTLAGARLRERLFARLYSAPPAVTALSERDQRTLRDVLQRVVSKSTGTEDRSGLSKVQPHT